MITPGEEDFIREYAHLPEHIISYGTAVSRLEPFLTDGYLYFFQEGRNLVFIGYPLDRPPDSTKMDEILKGVDRLPASGAGCDPGPFHSRRLWSASRERPLLFFGHGRI